MDYRAAVLVSDDGQGETVMTRPDQSELSDAELVAEALAEAERADLRDPRTDALPTAAAIRVMVWHSREEE